MNEPEQDRIKELLRQALPPVGDTPGDLLSSAPDMWPAMLRKLDERAAPRLHVPWFDWVLAGALVCLLAAFPAAIPVLLYYL